MYDQELTKVSFRNQKIWSCTFFSLHFILKEQSFTIKGIYLTKSKYQVSFSCFGEFPFLGMTEEQNIGCMCFLLFEPQLAVSK